jgi:1,4-alpha-glucan branching enzyme
MGLDVQGLSRLVDPRRHPWTSEWHGRPWEEAVIYELHIGTFTAEGTFSAAMRRLPKLASLGFTAIEILPVPHGPGTRGWGYDGCLLAAPHPAYGTPQEMKRLVEAAQGLGLMVILDVVMNHFSPAPSFRTSCWAGSPNIGSTASASMRSTRFSTRPRLISWWSWARPSATATSAAPST